MPALNSYSSNQVAELAKKQLKRNIATSERQEGIYIIRDNKKLLSFCCNDYFGLSQHPAVIEASVQATKSYGAGAGASRLVTGSHPLYEKLEDQISIIKNTKASCVFGSGYLANIGVIPALVGKGDLIVADKLVHSCIIDGIKLSGAEFVRFKHNDIDSLKNKLAKRTEYKKCLIITETVFSMDGDKAPLEKIRMLANENDAWMMTDDAHGLGLSGIEDPSDVKMGTLSKAAGSYGGYVAGSNELVELVQNKSRSLVYSTALPPGVIAASIEALKIIKSDLSRTNKPYDLAKEFAKKLNLPQAESLIIPIIVGDTSSALDASQKLEEQGFLVSAIRPPTVPVGSARLRVTFSTLHKESHANDLADKILELGIL